MQPVSVCSRQTVAQHVPHQLDSKLILSTDLSRVAQHSRPSTVCHRVHNLSESTAGHQLKRSNVEIDSDYGCNCQELASSGGKGNQPLLNSCPQQRGYSLLDTLALPVDQIAAEDDLEKSRISARFAIKCLDQIPFRSTTRQILGQPGDVGICQPREEEMAGHLRHQRPPYRRGLRANPHFRFAVYNKNQNSTIR